MKKKKKFVLTPTIKGILLSVVIIPAIAFSWKNIQSIWASPEHIEKVERKVLTHDEVQAKLSSLVVEQQARLDKQEAVYQANLESTKEQLALIAELKRKK